MKALTYVNCGIVSSGVTIRIGRFPVQNSLGALPGLWTQPSYESTRDLWLEIVKTQRLTSDD